MPGGAVIDRMPDANLVPVNTADSWLHLGLGLGVIALGAVALSAERNRSETRAHA